MKIFSMQHSTKSRMSVETSNLEIQNDEINSTISSISLQGTSNSSIDDDLTSLSWLIELNKTNSTFPDSIIKPILELDNKNINSLNNEKNVDGDINCNSYMKNKKYINNINSNFKLSNDNSKVFKPIKHTSLNYNKIQTFNTSGLQIKGANRRQSAIDRFNNFIEQVKKTKVEYDLLSDSYLNDSVNKPPFNYSQIIGMAMIENGRMTLQQICNWIQMKFCYYRKRSNWNNSIRHNLSLQFCFRKIDRNKYEKGKGGYWELAMDLKKSERKRIRNRKSTAMKYKLTEQSNRNRVRNKNQTTNISICTQNKNDSDSTLNLPSGTVLSQIILNSIQEVPVSINKSKDVNEKSNDHEENNKIENSNQQIENNSLDQNQRIVIDSEEMCNVYNEIFNNLDVTEDELNAALNSQNSNLVLNNHFNEDFINKRNDTKLMSQFQDTYMANNKALFTTENQYVKNQISDDKNVVVSSYLNNLKPINGPNVIVESLPILYSTFLTRSKSDDKNEYDSNFTITSPSSFISSNSNSIVLNSATCCSCYNCSSFTYKNTETDCKNCKNSVITIIESQMNQKIEEKFGRDQEYSKSKCNQNCEYHQESLLMNQNIQQNFLRPFLDNIDEAFNLLRNSETEYRGCDDLLDGIYDISVNDF